MHFLQVTMYMCQVKAVIFPTLIAFPILHSDSLPTSTEGSTAPPAIPPRLSVRLIDRKDGPPHPGKCELL